MAGKSWTKRANVAVGKEQKRREGEQVAAGRGGAVRRGAVELLCYLYLRILTLKLLLGQRERKAHTQPHTRADLICLPNDIILLEKGQLQLEKLLYMHVWLYIAPHTATHNCVSKATATMVTKDNTLNTHTHTQTYRNNMHTHTGTHKRGNAHRNNCHGAYA